MGNKMTGASDDEQSERQQKLEAWRRCIFPPFFTCVGILFLILMMSLVKLVSFEVLLPIAGVPMLLVGLGRLLRNFGQGVAGTSSKAPKDVSALNMNLPMAIEYQHITAGHSTIEQACNDVQFAGHHYSRFWSFEQLKAFRIFTDSEQKSLEKELKFTDAHNLLGDSAAVPIVNYLAWRRSALHVLLMVCIAIVGFEIHDLANVWGKYQDAYKEEFNIDFNQWRLTTIETFPSCLEDYAINFPEQRKWMIENGPLGCDSHGGPVPAAKMCQESCAQNNECLFWNYECGNNKCMHGTLGVPSKPLKRSEGTFGGSRDCNMDELPMVPSVDLSFTRFSKDYLNSLADRWAEGSHKYSFVKQCLLLLSKFAVLGFVARALITWGSLRRSGLMIRVAWMLAFLGPFAASCIPFRAVAPVGELTATVPFFVNESAKHYNLEEKFQDAQGELLELCRVKLPKARNDAEELKDILKAICHYVHKIPTIKTFFLKVDPSGAQRMCKQATSQFTQENIDQTFTEMERGCKTIHGAMASLSDNSADMFDMLQAMMEYLGLALDSIIGSMNALVASKNIVPAAMSVGPGLLKGAAHAKSIVPEASIPGIFLIVLPWLYAPLTWLICNVVVQFTGTVFVLFALMSFAFAPIVSGIIAFRLSANYPMTEKQMQGLTYWISLWNKLSLAISAIFVISYIVSLYVKWEDEIAQYSHRYKEMLDRVGESVLAADLDVSGIMILVLSIFVNFFLKMSMTMIVATDYMLQETAFQRQFEDLDAQMDTLPQHIQDCAREIKTGRKRRLNALVIAIEGKDEGPGRFAKFFRSVVSAPFAESARPKLEL